MQGAWGGRREPEGEAEVSGAVLAALAGQEAAPPTEPGPGLVLVELGEAGLRYPVPPGDEPLEPWGAGAPALRALVRAAERTAALHAAGRPHGDLRPATIWVGPEEEVLLLTAARCPAAGALLAARLQAGAAPTEVGWCAPEVIGGAAASPAADVYALAALAHAALVGRAPLGAIGPWGEQAGSPGMVALLRTALHPDPALRPNAAALARALEAAAARAPTPRPAPAAEEGAPAFDPDEAPGLIPREPARPAHLSVLLAILLVVGGLFTFVGALAFVAVGWEALGPWGRFALLAALDGGVLWGGLLATRRGYARSGLTLTLLAVQLLWAVLAYLIDITELERVRGAWALSAVGVTAATTWLAVGRRSVGAGMVAALDGLAAVGACWGWLWHFPLEGWRLLPFVAGLLGLAAWAWRAQARAPWLTLGAQVLATQSLWVVAAYVLELADGVEEPGNWALAGLLCTAASFALAAWRDSALLGLLSALGFLITSACLGVALKTGHPYGPPVYLGLVAAAYAGLAWLGERLGSRRLSLSYASGGLLVAWASAAVGAVLLDGGMHLAFATAWPYLVALALGGLGWRCPQPWRGVALLGLAAVLTCTPIAQAFLQARPAWTQLAIGVGLLIIAAGFKLPALERSDGAQLLALLLGLVVALLPATALCLGRCFGQDGFALLQDGLSSGGRVWESEFIWLSMEMGLCAGLVGLGILFAPLARRPLPYRLLEGAGVLAFFFVLTVLSLSRTQDTFYPLLILVGGGALLGVGLYQRRLALALPAGLGLLLNLWIQYFAKLSDTVPVSLLCLGFGLALLIGGVTYERKVRHLLPAREEWR